MTPAANNFAQNARETQAPATSGFVITPHDTNELTAVTRGIFVGGAGDVAARLSNDTATLTFKNVPAGAILPIRAKIVTTATTATDLVALV